MSEWTKEEALDCLWSVVDGYGEPATAALEYLHNRIVELQSLLDQAKATELQLDARIRELTAERDAARASPKVVTRGCGKALECGGACSQQLHHGGPCLCEGDVDGVPGTCEA